MYFFYDDKKKQEKIMSLNFLRSPERYFIKIKVTYLFEAPYINKNITQSKIFYNKKLSTEFINC